MHTEVTSIMKGRIIQCRNRQIYNGIAQHARSLDIRHQGYSEVVCQLRFLTMRVS